MKYAEFERVARSAYAEIPDEYLEGIDGLVLSREAPRHPTLPHVYTLGECLTEEHLSDFGGPETTRSVIALYWGSFNAIARRDASFDWEGEVWETLTHELRHHLESLARDDALEGVDYASDETFKRREGLDFDPWYYQHGDDLGAGLYDVDGDVYVEQIWSAEEFEAAPFLEVSVGELRFRLDKPEPLGDIHFVWAEPLGRIELVVVRKRSWWEAVRRLMGTSRPTVLESEVAAEAIADTA